MSCVYVAPEGATYKAIVHAIVIRRSGGGVLAKIAVELKQALARRAATGGAACHPTCRVLARGDGWAVEDLICASGPQDPIFEERHRNVSIAMVLAGTFQYRGSPSQSFANGNSANDGSANGGSANGGSAKRGSLNRSS